MKRQWMMLAWFGIMLVLSESASINQNFPNDERKLAQDHPPVQLHRQRDQVVLDNGIVNITITVPEGEVIQIQYNGIQNLLERKNKLSNRGYWDFVWQGPGKDGMFDKLEGTKFTVIREDEGQVEVSFSGSGDIHRNRVPLNYDKRFILLRGSSGFYTYGIFERFQGSPDFDLGQGRTVFKLDEKLFTYMAVTDERQREMPSAEDRTMGKPLAFPEAVLVKDPVEEVDDKYQYSCENKDCWVHGWIAPREKTGFWMITPSMEFKTGGPFKQDLTSHVGPTILSMYFSSHYTGETLDILFRDGEPWKKVFGPVFVYLNSVKQDEDQHNLWVDAKKQLSFEMAKWPYNFVHSADYPLAYQRGSVSGKLLVKDSYISHNLIGGKSAYIGLAPPGDAGYWQLENKGYQFWVQADNTGNFEIKNIRPGTYNLYASVPGFIGDYKYQNNIVIKPGSRFALGDLVFQPLRSGPTLWEIGYPDRSAQEFLIPDPNPKFVNRLFIRETTQKFRQYGLWDRYTDMYPKDDLVFKVGVHNESDWFFAHVNRVSEGKYIPTNRQISFDLESVDKSGNYMLRIALASATEAEMLVKINSLEEKAPQFSTRLIGKDNSIARHGIHGLYWLYSLNIPASHLRVGSNSIYLTQTRGGTPWSSLLYDYIRLEGPPSKSLF